MIPPVMTTDPLPATKRKKKQKKSAPVRKEKSRNVKRKKETEVQMKRQKEHRYSAEYVFLRYPIRDSQTHARHWRKKRKKNETNPCGLRNYKTAIMGTKKGIMRRKTETSARKGCAQAQQREG